MFVYKKFNQDFQCNINLEKDEWTHRKGQEKIDLDFTLLVIPDKNAQYSLPTYFSKCFGSSASLLQI